MDISAEFNKPGMAPVQIGRRLWVAVLPWPEYGEAGTPFWRVRVVGGRPIRRYTLGWSSRLLRWVGSESASRMHRDLPPEALRDLENHIRDTLEGALC